MGIVRGFSDLLKPVQNLATNGNFRINQRGLFTSSTACKVGDYVADAWVVEEAGMDYIECLNNPSAYYLSFSGYGKKGQNFKLRSKDLSVPYGAGFVSALNPAITASVEVNRGSTSVPIIARCFPRIYSVGQSIPYTFYAQPQKSQSGQSVSIIRSNLRAVNYGAYVEFTLLGDGTFSVALANFSEIFGEFKHPPYGSPVHYSEDLARCKRYYQVLIDNVSALGGSDGTNYKLGKIAPLQVEMAGTPSITMSLSTVKEEGADVDAKASYSSASSATSKAITWSVSKAIAGSKPREATVQLIASV